MSDAVARPAGPPPRTQVEDAMDSLQMATTEAHDATVQLVARLKTVLRPSNTPPIAEVPGASPDRAELPLGIDMHTEKARETARLLADALTRLEV